jgi:uncharacterized protein YndB with AHSA1/START domain
LECDFVVEYSYPVEDVWPYLAEPERWAEYVPALVGRTRLGDGPIGPGTKWKSIDRVGPWLVEFTDELVEVEPHKKIVWRHSPPWNARTEYTVADDGGRTVVNVSFVAKLQGKLRLLDLMPDSWATNVFRKDMERLEGVLDSEHPS